MRTLTKVREGVGDSAARKKIGRNAAMPNRACEF